MYQEVNILSKASGSSRKPGHMGGGGGVIGGSGGKGGSQHARKRGAGGGKPLNFRPGFLVPVLILAWGWWREKRVPQRSF